MEMEKENINQKKNGKGLLIAFILSIILIVGLVGYICYDKDIIVTKNKTNVKEPKETKEKSENNDNTSTQTIEYNKDGYFIKSLIASIRLKDGRSHREYQLYSKDKVTVEDLGETYLNDILYKQMMIDLRYDPNWGFTSEALDNASLKLFGKKVISSTKNEISMNCSTYKYDPINQRYDKDPYSDGCGGTHYFYPDYITKVETDDNSLYIYQKIAFQGTDGYYANISQVEGSSEFAPFSYSDKIAPENENGLEDITPYLEQLNEYKYTFVYDKNNNIYIFQSVEKV